MRGKVSKSKLLKQDYARLFQDLVSSLPPHCASLKIVDDSSTGYLTVVVTPSSDKAARIHAEVDDRVGVTLSFGKGAVFEVPVKGMRYTNLPCLEEVRALCMAVMAGRFEEEVLLVGTDVLGARAKIYLDKPVNERWRELKFYPFRRIVKENLKYSAYCNPNLSTPAIM